MEKVRLWMIVDGSPQHHFPTSSSLHPMAANGRRDFARMETRIRGWKKGR
jgi:hypothetical protein